MKINFLSFLGKQYIDFIYFSSKKHFINLENIFKLWNSNKKTINIFWHNRIALMPKLYTGKGIKILISEHSDGEIITRIVKRYKGLNTVRGSTRRGAIKGLKALIKEIKDFDICITPDGPRGPKYKLQDGVIFLAKLTGYPIIPLAYNVKKKYIFNSWDNFIFPYPFNEVVYVAGDPIYINKTDEISQIKNYVEDSLKKVTEIADNYFEKS